MFKKVLKAVKRPRMEWLYLSAAATTLFGFVAGVLGLEGPVWASIAVSWLALMVFVRRDPHRGSAPQAEKLSALFVTTYGRSDGTLKDRDRPRKDWVVLNTDFERLLDPDQEYENRRVFFCNELTQLAGYKNSHWDQNTIQDRTYEYIATIVWPIRHVRERLIDGKPHIDMSGFLAVDTLTADSFDFDKDFAPGAAFADTLYGFFKVAGVSASLKADVGGRR